MEESGNPKSLDIAHDQVVCTLFEGDFHYGVAALVNSLIRAKFQGLIWVGHREELPAWTRGLTVLPTGCFDVGGASLYFEKVNPDKHFGQFKPDFLSSLIDRGIVRRALWYFDPDITIRCSWSFFEMWVEHGVSLCQEITMGTMPSTHPIRCAWIKLARAAGWGDPVRQQERYYNSGFVGMVVEHAEFLRAWQNAVKLANSTGIKSRTFQKGNRQQIFFTIDQDSLNVATMYANVPISAIGPEGMSFIPGGFTMFHAVGAPKPWRKQFLTAVLKGVRVNNGDRHFLACADGPVHAYSASHLKFLKIQAAIAGLIGRFYRKDWS
jgi:hypothetical protein